MQITTDAPYDVAAYNGTIDPQTEQVQLDQYISKEPLNTDTHFTATKEHNNLGDYTLNRLNHRLSPLDGDDDGWFPDDFDDDNTVPPPPEEPPPPTVDSLSEKHTNLSRLAEEERYANLDLRSREVRQVLRALVGGVDRQSSVLIGEGKDGKLDVIKQLAHTMTHSQLPPSIAGKQLIMCDTGTLLLTSDTEIRKFVDDCLELKDEVICVIPHLNKLDNWYNRETIQYIKEKMAEGLQVITTIDRKKDRIFEEHEKGVTRIFIKEKRRAQVLKLLQIRYVNSVEELNIKISETVMNSAIDIVKGILGNDRKNLELLFDRCALLIDLAIGELMLRQAEEEADEPLEVTTRLLREVAPLITNGQMQVSTVAGLRLNAPLELGERLATRVIGQDQAIDRVSNAILRWAAGLKNPQLPVGSFLFMGPTGVGKTELAKRVAEELFGDEKAMIRFDMSEYQEKHTVSRLFGSPPGYVGYGEGGQLTNAVLKNPNCVVLLDEIEKAHQDVRKTLLQVFDDGRMTDGQGRTVDFSNVLFIMTSNFEAQLIIDLYKKGYDASEVAQMLEPALKRELSPELYNRLEAVPFNGISEEVFRQIIPLMMNQRAAQIEELKGIKLTWGEDVYQYLVNHGYSEELGLRPLRRVIDNDLVGPLALAILKHEVNTGETAEFYVDQNNKIAVRAYEGTTG